MRTKELGKMLRGMMILVLGLTMIASQIGCSMQKNSRKIPDEGEKIIYNADSYKIIQGKAVHKAGGSDSREYIFIPLTFSNMGDNNIIFSSTVCIKAYALPSGEVCNPADRGAIASAKQSIKDFAMFDGIIHGNEDTKAWLIFDAPIGTEQMCINFFTGCGDNDFITFNCAV